MANPVFQQFLEGVGALSPGAQALVAIVVGSAAWIAWRLLASVFGVITSILSLLPKPRRAQPAPSDTEATRTPPRAKAPQPKGVSLKSLQKAEATKGRHGHGTDRHAGSGLFIAGLRGHTAEVTGLAWSPDGESLATACDDRTVRLFDLRDPTAKSVPFRKKELRVGVQDVAFGDDAHHVAVQTKGMVNAAGLAMLDFRPKEPVEEWAVEGVHAGKAPGLGLAGAATSKGGYGILASSSTKTDLRVFSTTGRQLGALDTGGFNNYGVAVSRDGRWVAAPSFVSDVKVYEVQFDRLGAFTGVKLAMALKGHKSKVCCLAFSPDLTKAVTASGDGLLKVWNLNVRYHMDEDPKVLLSTGLSLLPGKCYSRLAWGPDGLIAGACGAMLHFLDARTGEVVERVEEAHDADITALEWSSSRLRGPQGPTAVLASAGNDGRVRLWAAPKRLV